MADTPAVKISQSQPKIAEEPPPPAEGSQPQEKPKKEKKKKLTKAERKARKLAAQIEFRKQEIRNRLVRELALSKKNYKRGRLGWEEICREVKILEFREELMMWDEKTTRMVNQKDEKVTMLLEDMDTTEEMHRRHFARQLQVMDFIIRSYKTMLTSIKALYESQAAGLIKDFQEELNSKEDTEGHIRTHCENIMHGTNLIVESQMQNDYKIFLLKREDVVNTEIEMRYRVRNSVVNKMKALHEQLNNYVYELQHSTLDVHKYEKINALMDRQRNYVNESQKLNEAEFALKCQVNDLQRELLRTEVDSVKRMNELRLELDYFQNVRKAIEKNMEIDKRVTFDKLKTLCTETFDMIKEFHRMEKSGELLLCLASTCRKLQTESEKVVPWGQLAEPKHLREDDADFYEKIADYFSDLDLPTSENLTLKVLDLRTHLDLSEEELLEQMTLMDNFWRRQALVEAQNLLLKEEKAKLTAENQKYIDFIRSMSKTDRADELLELVNVTLVLPEVPACQTQYRLVNK